MGLLNCAPGLLNVRLEAGMKKDDHELTDFVLSKIYCYHFLTHVQWYLRIVGWIVFLVFISSFCWRSDTAMDTKLWKILSNIYCHEVVAYYVHLKLFAESIYMTYGLS